MIDEVKILNINIQSITKENLLLEMNEGILFTPNVDHLIKLQKDKDFYNTYKKANWIICDSKILSFFLRILGTPIKEVIPGSSLFTDFYNYHKSNNEVRIFLLGAAPGVADKAKNIINNKIGRNIVVGAFSPSFGFENDERECIEIINKINGTDATVLVVGVGAPKQEKWIAKYNQQFTGIRLFMALGATIDFEAGNLKRAPKIFQNLSLEWLYRLIKEPKRLWKRYLIDDLPVFCYVFKQRVGIYKNPF